MVAFSTPLSHHLELIEETLSRLIPEEALPYHRLFQAARYSLLGGGKRFRPLLALAVCKALDGSIQTALEPACAIEMVHTYSMIHDDLPCMDNDDFRRGKPTLHKAFPEAHAVLAGDFLLTQAFKILARAPGLDAERKIRLINVLAEGAGGHGMIAGQIMDMEAAHQVIDLDRLRHIHHCKTGALIAASVAFGTIIGNATEEQAGILEKFAVDLGLMFQVRDDILDATSSIQKHGREVSSDVINGKATYVSLLGLESSRHLMEDLSENVRCCLRALACDTAELSALVDSLISY